MKVTFCYLLNSGRDFSKLKILTTFEIKYLASSKHAQLYNPGTIYTLVVSRNKY